MTSQRSIRRVCAAMAATVSVALLAACGGGSSDAPSSTAKGGAAAPATIRVALTSPTQPNWVATKYGVLTYGKDFGLNMTPEDFTTFESHSIATQTVLSGKADVVAGSFVSDLLLIDKGQKFKAFCPYISQDDFVIAGANGVKTIGQLFDKGTRVAMDSPGGAGSVIFDAMIQAAGESRSTGDMPNPQILESSGLRESAYAAGKVDATVIHEAQYKEAAPQVKQPVVIATLYKEVPNYLKEVQAAPTAWLDKNTETAASYCAAVLKGMRVLKGDFSLFQQASQKYSETEKLDEATLKTIHGLIAEYGFWPSEDGGLDKKTVDFMSQVAVKSGLIKKAPAYEDVVDRRVLDRALEILKEKS